MHCNTSLTHMQFSRNTIFFFICCISMFIISCGDDGSLPLTESTEPIDDIFTVSEWDKIKSLSPLPDNPPPSPTNRVADNANASKLGQMFFFDERFSKDATIACATCHSPFHGFADVEATSLGNGRGTRNAPTLLNAAYNNWQFWDGRADSLWAQTIFALEGEKEQAGNRLQFSHLVYKHYKEDYESVFGSLPDLTDTNRFPKNGKPGDYQFDNMSDADKIAINSILANIGKAIEAYERLLISRNSPFDQYVAGDVNAIGIQAKQGLKVFIREGSCIECHNSPTLTDNKFHNVGLPQGNLPLDYGRSDGIKQLLENPFNGLGIYSDNTEIPKLILDSLAGSIETDGQFKTPSLRNVALTAPYMHTGDFPTLKSILSFNRNDVTTAEYVGIAESTRNSGILTQQEMSDLVEFLQTLTGELPPEHLLQKPKLPE
ncbi:hypothetical protein C6497_08180 [Candidatus Poribacteria bacterium]|nr:MAG: hypothetical protein C6497_08180 [Candidatus Poribacteria bacterium]